MFARLLLILTGALALAACATGPASVAPERPITILVSIDGGRADYLDRGVTPTLSAMAAEGVRVRTGLQPTFPSITFPNHYTLVTGLHADHHGIVSNRMVDPAIPGEFRLSDRAQVMDRRWWDDAEPLWVTAEAAGIPTATMFWPGSEAPIHGVRPGLWVPFQQAVPSSARVDIVLGWLTMPEAERPRFITLYFDVVDTAGHEHGPDSPELAAALGEVDTALKRLRDGLAARGLTDRVNLVVVADHGMTAVSNARVVLIDDLIDVGRVRLMEGEALVGFYPAEGYRPALEAALLRDHPHMDCWRKGDIPARLVYGAHRRVPPYVCLAELGWSLRTAAGIERARASGRVPAGLHGYDPAQPDMHALFVAAGPDFRRGVTLDRADSVDVYALVARLIGVTPRPNDGNLAELGEGLRASRF